MTKKLKSDITELNEKTKNLINKLEMAEKESNKLASKMRAHELEVDEMLRERNAECEKLKLERLGYSCKDLRDQEDIITKPDFAEKPG